MRLIGSGALALLLLLPILLALPDADQAAAFGPASYPQSAASSDQSMLRLPVPEGTQRPVLLRIRPSAGAVGVGDPVTVDLLLENADPLFGVDLTVAYDPALLALEGIDPGGLFPDGRRYVMSLDPRGTPGRVRYISTLLGDATPSASTGIVASIRFRTVASGQAALTWVESDLKLSDRESVPLTWTIENASLGVIAPTATPAPASGGSSSGGSAREEEPTPTHTPRPTSTPHPTHTPRPVDTPTATPVAGSPVGGDLGFNLSVGQETDWGNPLFPEPTAGPTIGVTIPQEIPRGIPTVTRDGVVALLDSTPGVGVVTVPFGDSTAEFRVDNQGSPVAVRVQPAPVPADPALPPGVVVARAFALDLYGLDGESGDAHRLLYDDGRGSATIVLKWRLGESDYNATLDESGTAHPDRLLLYRISPQGELVKVETVWDPEPAPCGTLTALFLDRCTFLLAVLPVGQVGQTVPVDPRYFRETGFRVNRDAFWDYFRKRGGINSFGFPISREFVLGGFPVQLFQRAMLQEMPDGSVSSMNLLDSGLMPYSHINSSSFPAPDEAMIMAAPRPTDPDYADRAIAFVRSEVPDRWAGQPVGFRSSFFSRVRLEDAFPDGGGEPALLPLLNLEMWGLPTSRPARDPRNHNFVYQRFQRGILHYDVTTGATQGLLLGDYLKSLMTGRNLPADLERDARGSIFYRQYDRTRPGHVGRPWELTSTDLKGAFEMDVPQEVVAASPNVSTERRW